MHWMEAALTRRWYNGFQIIWWGIQILCWTARTPVSCIIKSTYQRTWTQYVPPSFCSLVMVFSAGNCWFSWPTRIGCKWFFVAPAKLPPLSYTPAAQWPGFIYSVLLPLSLLFSVCTHVSRSPLWSHGLQYVPNTSRFAWCRTCCDLLAVQEVFGHNIQGERADLKIVKRHFGPPHRLQHRKSRDHRERRNTRSPVFQMLMLVGQEAGLGTSLQEVQYRLNGSICMDSA